MEGLRIRENEVVALLWAQKCCQLVELGDPALCPFELSTPQHSDERSVQL